MYSGIINREVVFCCHPVVVIGKTGVAASFETEDDALRFLIGRGLRAGAVYRHDGSKWDRLQVDVREAYARLFREEGGSAV
jgi:hypothetical protein